MLLGLGKGGVVTLRQWRQKRLGPPVHVTYHGAQERVLYPVEGLQRWLEEATTTFRLHPDPRVFEAFGLRPPSEEAAA